MFKHSPIALTTIEPINEKPTASFLSFPEEPEKQYP